MSKEICMPKYGATMESGEVSEWLIKVGDEIKKGDPVAEISSEKLTNTLESLEDGVVEELLVDEGDDVLVGAPIIKLK
ncbi:Biotin-requiring enzyme [anaerobic digester metagenome]